MLSLLLKIYSINSMILQYKQFIHQLNQKMDAKLGEDIINMYKPYRNSQAEWQVTIKSSKKFEIYKRYQIINVIGHGAYGTVVAARDLQIQDKNKQYVAIKKMERVFDHKIFAKRTLRQLKLLRLLKHENIMNLQTIILPKSREQFDSIYIVTELIDTDLTEILKSGQQLTQEHCKFFLYQLLRGLKFIHSAKVVHRDLKPRNILINSNCDLKICDFGLARSLHRNVKATSLTDYVATRWYRAPQLLLSAEKYTVAVDMWSVGCIFAEMLLRKPFLPGSDTQNQIFLIVENLGGPSIQNMKHVPQESRKLIQSLSNYRSNGKDFKKLFPNVGPEAIDLLKKLLAFNPDKRATVQSALQHPYLSEFHLEQDQPTRSEIDELDFEFEDHKLTTQQYKDIIYEEILLYHNKQFFEKYEKKKKKKESLIKHILQNSNRNNYNSETDSDQ